MRNPGLLGVKLAPKKKKSNILGVKLAPKKKKSGTLGVRPAPKNKKSQILGVKAHRPPASHQQLHPDIEHISLNTLAEPIRHRHIVLGAQREFRLPHSCMDRAALVHGERPVPVMDEK